MVSQAVRGILDARPYLGRYFSAYYYYAKHVASSSSWRNMCRKFGCFYAAGRMVESYHRLSKRQQRLFVKKSFEHHSHRYYSGTKNKVKYSEIGKPSKQLYFGNEPTPPPRHAHQLYEKEMEENETATPWESLDDETQMLYVKKLYKLTRYYITQYENFVKNMVPSEMIDYLIEKSREFDQSWAYKEKYENIHQKFKNAESLPLARDTYALEMSNDEQDSEPELYDPSDRLFNANVTTVYRFKNNPFSIKRHGRVTKNALVKTLRKKKKQEILKKGKNNQADSDIPSSDDEDDYKDPTLTVKAALRKKQRSEKLRDVQRFNYPLQDYQNMETGSVARSQISDERRLLGERLMQKHPLVTGILDHIMDVLHSRTPASEELKNLASAAFKSARNNEPQPLAKQKGRKCTTDKPHPKRARAPRKSTATQKGAGAALKSSSQEMEPQQSKDESSSDTDEVRREPPIPSFALVTSSPKKSVGKQKSSPSKLKSKLQDFQVDPPYLGETNEQSQDCIADALDTEISQYVPSGTVEFDVDDAFYGTQDFFSMEEFNEAQLSSHEYFN